MAAEDINHQKVNLGVKVRRPLQRNRLRVLVDSYVAPARENKAGEERPWAKIIIKAPAHP